MTKFATFILTVSLALTACSDQTADKSQTEKITADSSAHTDTTAHKDNIVSVDTFSIPTKSFLDIVSVFDSAGFTPDTNRIKKVPYYYWAVKTNPIFLIHNVPFYKMAKVTNPIFYYLTRHSQDTFSYPTNTGNYAEVSNSKTIIKKGVFQKVKTITGFYFTPKTPTSDYSFSTDGFVEEWEFATSTDAQSVESALTNRDNHSPMYYFIYFNSFSQVFRKENRLYTFYSRACWDGRLLEKLYEQVIKKISADSWTKAETHY